MSRERSGTRAAGRWVAVLALTTLTLGTAGCGTFRGQLEPVDDGRILALAERADAFYHALENRTLDTMATFEDRELRSFFADDTAFSDYYASLASQVRRALMRGGRVEEVLIADLIFEESNHARVYIELRGSHQRMLRFWGVELYRIDSWRQLSGRWFLVPEDL